MLKSLDKENQQYFFFFSITNYSKRGEKTPTKFIELECLALT